MRKTSSFHLKAVKKRFGNWRLNKKQGAKKKIPGLLWLRVCQLINRYETSKIVAQLTMSTQWPLQ